MVGDTKPKWAERSARVLADHKRSIVDAVVVGCCAVAAVAVGASYDVFEQLYEFVERYEEYELDELIIAAIVLAVASSAYSVRRVFDLRNQIRMRAAAEEESRRLARHDALTGLPNRRELHETFANCVQTCSHTGKNCALLVVDLDYFKAVNDLHGHSAGDEVLCEVAHQLQHIVKEPGIVARLGGDEFVVVSPVQPDSPEAESLARRIVHQLSKPLALAGTEAKVGASVGIALHPTNGDDLEELLRQADIAMYRAKSDGRGLYRFFDREMDEKLRMRIQIERELKTAIEKGEIVPYYQMLVDLKTGGPVGFEILARWDHPTRGVLLPDDFISIAEDTGLINDLTYSLLRRACREAATWSDDLHLSLNLAPEQITDSWLPQSILGILSESNFPAHRLEIEITETALVKKLDEVKAVLRSLHNMGIRIALDDFGTGYCGLYHLRELSVDRLKIDQSFVLGMASEPEQAIIVKAILSLGKSFGLECTAEGVNNPQIRNQLNELGCEIGQGHYFGRPQPADEVVRSLKKRVTKTKVA